MKIYLDGELFNSYSTEGGIIHLEIPIESEDNIEIVIKTDHYSEITNGDMRKLSWLASEISIE